MGGRLRALDSLRGLAALDVFVHHCVQLLPGASDGTARLAWLKWTPLHSLWAGHQDVLLFFVLSGFVLGLPYVEGRAPAWPEFLLKRAFRLYPPFLAALLLSAVLEQVVHGRPPPGVSQAWFQKAWVEGTLPGLIAGHAALVGPIRYDLINPALWSLVYEMRVSLAFPLLMLILVRSRTVPVLAVAGLAGFLASLMTVPEPTGAGDLLITFEYGAMFVLGAALARHRQALVAALRSLSRPGRAALAALALLAFGYPYWAYPVLPFMHVRGVDDAVALGACVVAIGGALAWPGLGAALERRPLQWLGKVSYSFYLLHLPILFLAAYIVGGLGSPVWVAGPAALVPALGAAALLHRTVERPSMEAGRWLARCTGRWLRGSAGSRLTPIYNPAAGPSSERS